MSRSIHADLDFIFCSDLHLGSLKNLFGDNATRLILSNYDKCFAFAVQEGISTVIIGGDVADKSPLAQEDLLELLQLLHKYPTLQFHILMGNHDFDSLDNHALSMLEWLGEVKLVKNCTVYTHRTLTTIGGVPFCFVPHPFTEAESTDYPKVNVGHFELKGSIRDNGSKGSSGVELPETLDYWLLGHLHTHQRNKKHRATYGGNLFQKTFGEKLPKGFLVCKVQVRSGKLRMRSTFEERTPTFKLINRYVDTSSKLKVTNKPNLRYKLLVDASLELPEHYLEDNPSIAKLIVGEKDELATIRDFSLDIDTDILDGENLETVGLENFLSAQGLDENQVDRAIELREEVLCHQ